MKPFTACMMVGLGGFAGSVLRYGLSVLSQRLTIEWPAGTMAANVMGCLFVGILMELIARGASMSPAVRLLLVTGFCGGFTTMSTMIYETSQLFRSGPHLHGWVYSLGTLALSMIALFVGILLVRLIFRPEATEITGYF